MRITYSGEGDKEQTHLSLAAAGGKGALTIPGHWTRAQLRPFVGEAGEPSRQANTLKRLRAAGILPSKS